MPDTKVLRHIRPQINFPWNNHIDEIPNIVTFTGNIIHIVQNFINLPVNASIPHVFDPPKVQQDKQIWEFLRGKICCQNFINQDLTFLQLSVINVTQPKEDSILPEAITTEVLPITPQESNTNSDRFTKISKSFINFFIYSFIHLLLKQIVFSYIHLFTFC